MLGPNLAVLKRQLEAKMSRTTIEEGLLDELRALDKNVLLEKAYRQPETRAFMPTEGGCRCCGKS